MPRHECLFIEQRKSRLEETAVQGGGGVERDNHREAPRFSQVIDRPRHSQHAKHSVLAREHDYEDTRRLHLTIRTQGACRSRSYAGVN